MIALEDIKINGNSVDYFDMHCSNRVKQLLKCNGLQNICDVTDVDIFDIIEEYVDRCFYRSSSRTVCIIYNCISGKWYEYVNVKLFAFDNMFYWVRIFKESSYLHLKNLIPTASYFNCWWSLLFLLMK